MDKYNKYLVDFISSNNITPGRALDFGAGNMCDVKYLQAKGWFAEGVDIINGIDLNKPYISKNAPFDMVYSNYLLHNIRNIEVFIENIYNNLRSGGYVFIHTLDESDTNTNSGSNFNKINKILISQGFTKIKHRIIEILDNELGHNHYHKLLEITAIKCQYLHGQDRLAP
ncbi:MAG TPA: methyltransferase domain-containing protein [bacterium]|nr:methyltransferase domain-containing protein [bacterium]HPL56479.1 methyltransferase domain-containing protein [bacterium]